jgi:predicted peptidase
MGSNIFLAISSSWGNPLMYKGFVERKFKKGSTDSLVYRLFIPKDYSPSKKYPIMIALHGAGERGIDDTLQLKYKLATMWADEANQIVHPTFVLAPQCPNPKQWVDKNWSAGSYDFNTAPISIPMDLLVGIMDSLSKEFSLDPDRFYVSGMSMGGYGTWYLLMKYPTKFAAAIPVCGAGDPKMASAISKVAIWAFHAADDGVVPVKGSRDMIDSLKKAGGTPKYTEYAGSLGYGHNSWDPASNTPELNTWLYAQSRATVSLQPIAHKANHAITRGFFKTKWVDILGRIRNW